MASCKLQPAERMYGWHDATEEPTMTQVAKTPKTGVNLEALEDVSGSHCLKARPTIVGAKTTLIVEIMMPTASTETTVPKIHWAIKGVATMHKRVVDIVINTLKATSPPAIKVHKLDVCPPLMEPISTSPASVGASALINTARV